VEAIEQAAEHDRLAAQCHFQLVEVSLNRGDGESATRHSEAALWRAEKSGDPGLLAEILAQRGLAAFFSGAGIQHEVMQRAVALEQADDERSPYSRPSTQLGFQLLWSDDLDAARPRLERAVRRASERGEENDRAGLLFHLAHLEWEAGRVERAQRLTADVIEARAQLADAQTDSYVLWLRAFSALHGGDLVEARSRALEAMEVATGLGDHFIASFSSAIVAATDLGSGNPAAAHARLPELRDGLMAGEGGFVGSLTLPFWSLDIEALIALGSLDEAASVLAHLSARARGASNSNAVAIAHRCEGLLWAARGELPAAIAAMDAAVQAHALRLLPLELGRTLLEAGTQQRRLKRKGDAKRSLELALSTLEPLSAARLIARARDELGRIGLRRSTAGAGLTPAQRPVAERVVAGKTNREIGAELFMSLRTVESHLTVVYRHHGVRSRAQLVAAMSSSAAARASLQTPA
jgi:DNA-binding CsgD family transcriptional regulator